MEAARAIGQPDTRIMTRHILPIFPFLYVMAGDLPHFVDAMREMGLFGRMIDEEYGGSGYSYVELCVVLEEMGRRLLAAPYFSTVVLGANTILQSGDDAAKADLLPGIASGGGRAKGRLP